MDSRPGPENPEIEAVAVKPAAKKRAKRGRSKFTHYKFGSRGGRARNTTASPLLEPIRESTADEHPQPGTSRSAGEVNLESGGELHEDVSVEFFKVPIQIGEPVEDLLLDVEAEHENFPAQLHYQAEETVASTDCINSACDTIVTQETQTSCVPEKPDEMLIRDAVSELTQRVPLPWTFIQEEHGINALLLSRPLDRSVQQRVFFSFAGEKEVTVHCKPVSEALLTDILQCSGSERVFLSEETKTAFVEEIITVLQRLRRYQVCVGVDDMCYRNLWNTDKFGEIDKNPYREDAYVETFRPYDCQMLVHIEKHRLRRCSVCSQAVIRFRAKSERHHSELAHSATPNIHLDRGQLLTKVKKQQRELKYARSQITVLKEKLHHAICSDGVCIDEDMSQDLAEVLSTANLTPVQNLFFAEQIKAARAKKPSGRRWHPTLLRFALLLRTTSASAYQSVRDSGVVLLPCERTLFEYSHVIEPTEGCTNDKLNRICKILSDKYPEPHQQYHMLMMDEMHVNKKLVYQKSTGEMIGYVNLDEAEKDLANLEAELKGESDSESPKVASKMLTFMIKGISNGVTEVVASYATGDGFDSEDLNEKVWEVIGCLERSGIKIIGIVSDGAGVNRSFYASHLPLTKKSNVIFDTVNQCAPSRPLYFFSDVPHLLKTIRNCFYKSGSGPSYTRLLTKGNEIITWQTIRRLYNEDKSKTLRRCFKLNSYNVNLNAYSIMKVNYAAQVMSGTVALDLETRKWPGTSETVTFIREVNDFFDRLNGASTYQGTRKANKNLDPYTDVNDERFDQLLGFLKYLEKWNAEVEAKAEFSQSEKTKMLLSKQTLNGIEMTIRSFIAATRFLLTEGGVKFMNARVFCQDPLERFFGKQRQSGGGSRNPSVAQFLANEIKIGVHKDMNVRRSNVSSELRQLHVTDQPLPKRSRKSSDK